MCKYFTWQCGICLTDNEIAQRCDRMPQRCARNGDLLPLPQDAEGISCQWCYQPRHLGLKQTPPRFRHANKPVPNTPRCPIKIEAQWRVPAESDPFWLRPDVRLPDAAGKMAQYDQQRHLVLKAADEAMGSREHAQGGPAVVSSRQTLLYDEAWTKLKEGLRTG